LNKQIYINIAISLFSALLVFAGALLGAHWTSDRTEELWEKQENLIQIKAIIDKRTELISKVTMLANSAPKMIAYQSYLNLQSDLAKDYINCKKTNKDACSEPDSTIMVLDISTKRADLNAEFSSTIQLVALYYAGNTQDLANELGLIKRWWHTGEPAFRKLIKSMQNELHKT